jgi:branched-chain amino acid aminotransferase
MVNFNGDIIYREEATLSIGSRLVKYGDGLFETMKYSQGVIHFFEDHYFRLMSSMRILRMEIPMHFSPEYLLEQIQETIAANHLEKRSARIRLTVFRAGAGLYTPETLDIGWFCDVEPLAEEFYPNYDKGVILDLYKDHYKTPGLLSSLKSANSLLYVLAGVFSKENLFDDVLLINTNKQITDSISSNVFLLMGDTLKTPPLESGALRGVLRKQVLEHAGKIGLQVASVDLSPFDLQKADEVWLTNTIKGVQWVSNYRKKKFVGTKANEMTVQLNKVIRQNALLGKVL